MVRDSECFKKTEDWFRDFRREGQWKLQVKDRLFGPGQKEDSYWDMDLDFIAGNLRHHVLVYKEAADRLVTVILCGWGGLGDYADVYPILALYRHYIELSLKAIIHTAHTVLERPMSKGLRDDLVGRRGHEISWLWERAQEVAREAIGTDQEVEWDLMGDYIQQVHSIPYDLGRYPWTREGGSVDLPHEKLNLIQLRLFINRIGENLDGIDNYLEVLLDHRPDY